MILRKRMPELDTLRGVAVLLVFVYHGLFWSIAPARMTAGARMWTPLFRGGWSGVQLFFVLSGFLITGILMRSRGSSTYFRTFYLRRALRILPACLLLIAALLATGVSHWPFAFVSLAFLANLSLLLHVPVDYAPLWSLGVEEQFYALWPAAVRRASDRAIVVIAASVFAVTPLIRAIAFAIGARGGIYYFTWYNFDGLALGACLAVAAHLPRNPFATISAALLGSGVAMAIIVAAFGSLSRNTIAGSALLPTILYLLFGGIIGLTLVAGSSRFAALVNIRPLQWLGFISYGLYLVHVLAFTLFDRFVPIAQFDSAHVLLRFAAAGGLAIAVATLSRNTIERYFLDARVVLRGCEEIEGAVILSREDGEGSRATMLLEDPSLRSG